MFMLVAPFALIAHAAGADWVLAFVIAASVPAALLALAFIGALVITLIEDVWRKWRWRKNPRNPRNRR